MIVTVEELVDYMSNIELSADQREAAKMVLEGVQAELESHLGRPIEVRQFTESVTADSRGYVYPSQTPVISIVSVAGRTTAPPPWTNDGVWLGLGRWTITYTAGLNGADRNDLRLAVLRVAAREMQNRHDDTLGVKDLGTEDAPQLPVGWQPTELMGLERYRRRVMA